MEIANFIVASIAAIIAAAGVYYAYQAAEYAKKSWLDPVPNLDIEEKLKPAILDLSGSFAVTVVHRITNSSAIPAFLKEVDCSIKTDHLHVAELFQIGDEATKRELPFTLNPGESILLRTRAYVKIVPANLTLTLKTPNRNFPLLP